MIKKQLLAATIAATLSTGMIASLTNSVFAADKSPATTQTSAKNQTNEAADKDFVKVSEDALTSMRDVNGARLAIFNGQPEQARTFVDAAVTRMDAAVKDAGKYALDAKAPKTDDSYVPFDANLTVLNSFQPTAENAKQIAKANDHLNHGRKKEAIEALKLAEIDVAVTTSMVPVKFAQEHVSEAAKFVSEHKYYEANLALKAVDDAVVKETYAIDSVPKVKSNAKS